MKDNIGHEVHIGDRVFCLSGSRKNMIQTVEKLVVARDDYGSQIRVYLEGGAWISIYNLISLTALGVSVDEITRISDSDALGNSLHVDDKVLFLHPMEFYAEIGTVKKLTAKSCLLSIAENRFGQTEYRKKYEELISLSAIGKEDLVIQHCHD